MIIREILYSSHFSQELKKLPDQIIKIALRKEQIFKTNPLHPSLRIHPLRGNLEGLWSISVTGNYRILFKRKNTGDIHFISIGTHDIYKNL